MRPRAEVALYLLDWRDYCAAVFVGLVLALCSYVASA